MKLKLIIVISMSISSLLGMETELKTLIENSKTEEIITTLKKNKLPDLKTLHVLKKLAENIRASYTKDHSEWDLKKEKIDSANAKIVLSAATMICTFIVLQTLGLKISTSTEIGLFSIVFIPSSYCLIQGFKESAEMARHCNYLSDILEEAVKIDIFLQELIKDLSKKKKL